MRALVCHGPATRASWTEEGMSGGPVVDSQCGLLGVTESKSLFGEGGAFVNLSPSIVQKILAAMDQL